MMAETIESFVAKLQAEGVQTGQEEARKLCDEANKQAGQILDEARRQADKIVADANAQAQSIVQRGRSELELASRDAVLKLRDSLGKVIRAVLAKAASKQLSDVKFLGELLHDLVLLHAKSGLEGADSIRINVRPELHEKLADWAFGELEQKRTDESNISIDLKGQLAADGFEYSVVGATVEVTPESVVEVLWEMLTPDLREVIEKAVGKDAPDSASDGGNAGGS